MTDIQLYQPTSQLMEATSQTQIAELANRLMQFPPGKPLNQREASQLAVYSIMIDANPYAGEVYMTEVGPVKGIPLYRRKAKEWNRAMSPTDEDWDYKVNFRPAKDHEADFDPSKKDVAWVCELTDTKAEKEWQAAYVKFFNLLREGDDPAPWKFADERALMMAGPRPVWTGTGVVGGNEHFSQGEVERWEKTNSGKSKPVIKKDANGDPIYKQEMYDRNERAQKRAEKVAIKKRYPDMVIPAFGEVQDQNLRVLIEDAEGKLVAAEEIVESRTAAEQHQVARQAATDLGLDPDEIVGEFRDAAPAWDEQNAGDIYEKVTDSKNVPYKDKEVSALSFSLNALNKKIKGFGDPGDDAEKIAELEELKLKRDAAHYYINQKKEQKA